jgi:preprotein translocase subunit SecG
MLYTLMVVLYVIVCLFLIAVVLLQTGKRADLAGAFGGGGSQTAFGTRGAATFLSRMTTVFAVLFMILSLSLSIYSSGHGRSTGSVLDKVPTSSSAPAPKPQAPANQAPQNPTPAPQNPAPQPAPTK